MLDIRPDREAPVADAGPDQTVPIGTAVVLDGSGSSDDKGIKSYEWMVVEGSETVFHRGEKVTHLFGAPGQYNVTLTVTDHADKVAQDYVLITVSG
jgi:chitodextrinase